MLELRAASKSYRKGGRTIHAARDLDLRAGEGEVVVVGGPSGSGKSTLLLMAGGMLRPDGGRVLYDGADVYRWLAARRNRYRKRTVGFVFQRFFLMPFLSVRDNIGVTLALQGRGGEVDGGIAELAKRLGLADRLGHRPPELSVGEQQRVALARALVGGAGLILADEPTGNLDVENVRIIADCLTEEARRGRIIVIATHDPALLKLGTQSLRMEHGHLVAPESEPDGKL